MAAAEGTSSTAWTAALALGIGIGIQNFPEGAAISLPLKKEGISSRRAFCYGALSGIAEPIAGVLAVLIAEAVGAAMPWLLSFAAGAMVFVVAEGADSGSKSGEGFPYGDDRCHGWVCGDDDFGCGAGLNPVKKLECSLISSHILIQRASRGQMPVCMGGDQKTG